MNHPELGTSFVCRETAEHGVEWVVVAAAPSGARLVVPADTSPAVGSADLAVPASEAGSPLTLRCRFGLWVRPSLLAQDLKTRTLSAASCRAAAAKVDAFLQGNLRGEPLARETDEEYDYQQWLAEEIAPAHRALAAANAAVVASEAAREPRWSLRSPALAASLAAAGIGLGLWALSLKQQVAELRGPIGSVATADFQVGDAVRGEQNLRFLPGVQHFVVMASLINLPDYPSYRFELVDLGTGRQLAFKDGIKPHAEGEIAAVFLAPPPEISKMEVRVFGLGLAEPKLLGKQTYNVLRGEGPGT